MNDKIKDKSTTFSDNMVLPIHRWFKYTAGFSALWVEDLIRCEIQKRPEKKGAKTHGR